MVGAEGAGGGAARARAARRRASASRSRCGGMAEMTGVGAEVEAREEDWVAGGYVGHRIAG